MGAYDDLAVEAVDFGALQDWLETIKTNPAINETNIVDIFKDEAKEQMKLDLQVALNRNPEDADDLTFIDSVVTAQEPRLQRALAVKQLELALELMNEGEGSRTHSYWKVYMAKYDTIRKGFPGLVKRQGSTRVRTTGNLR